MTTITPIPPTEVQSLHMALVYNVRNEDYSALPDIWHDVDIERNADGNGWSLCHGDILLRCWDAAHPDKFLCFFESVGAIRIVKDVQIYLEGLLENAKHCEKYL